MADAPGRVPPPAGLSTDEVVVAVPGITSRHDVRRISAHIADIGGVDNIRVDLTAKAVTVQGAVPAEAVVAAVTAAGYAVSDPST